MIRFLFYLAGVFLPFIGNAQVQLPDLTAPVLNGSDVNRSIVDFRTSIRDINRVALSWKVADSILFQFVSIERSRNGNAFEKVGVLKVDSILDNYEWVDEAPAKGRNFYRLSYHLGETAVHSKVLSVLITGDISFKFYPNPVDNVLIIRTESPIEIFIADNNGAIKMGPLKISGLQTINVSNLEKGLYYLRIQNKLTSVITQERLIKN